MSSDQGNQTVRSAFNSTAAVLQLITMIIIIFSCCRFLRTRNMRKPLIILFYTFAFANSLLFFIAAVLREIARYDPGD